MSTNIADLIWKAGSATADRSYKNRYADVINVKDWGAVGDGVHDDRPNIQALLDYVSTGQSANPFGQYPCKAAIYFPPGNYRCSTFTVDDPGLHHAGRCVLTVNFGLTTALIAFCLYGDSSATTRIFYDGAIIGGSDNTILLDLDRYILGSYIGGLHFDMSTATGGSASHQNDLSLCIWNRGRFNGRTGSDQTYFDVKCTGATWGLGHSGEDATQGAENIYLFCKYEDCWEGWRTFSSNALDHNHFGGYAKNCGGTGVISALGALCSVVGMHFSGNTANTTTDLSCGDVSTQNTNPIFICGCNSTSVDFVTYFNGTSHFVGNYHHASSAGRFVRSLNNQVLDCNWSTNGRVTNAGHGGSGGPGFPGVNTLALRANQFDISAPYDGWTALTGMIENI